MLGFVGVVNTRRNSELSVSGHLRLPIRCAIVEAVPRMAAEWMAWGKLSVSGAGGGMWRRGSISVGVRPRIAAATG